MPENNIRKMKDILSADFVEDCGDSTSIYNCKLLKDDVTIREFWEAVKDSCDNKDGNVFNEWWANFNISFEFAKCINPFMPGNDGVWGMNVGLNYIF